MTYDVAALRAEQFPITRHRAYLDNASFGPLPRVAVEAAAAWLRQVSEGPDLPPPWDVHLERVRGLAARLLGCPAEDLAFVKSAAEGIGLVALGLDWRAGDEVIVFEHEFPAGVAPWLNLAHLDVRVRFIQDRGRHRFDVADVEELAGERTRVVCIGLVNFGNGFRAPVEEIAEVCRRHGAWLVVDATQAAGVLPVDTGTLGCHLLVAHGYKFLLSGYGTAVCYVNPELRARLRIPEPGWRTRPDDGARRFEPSIPDLTSVVGMGASLELLLRLGVDAVAERTLGLVGAAAEALAGRGVRLVSSTRQGERSSILSLDGGDVTPQHLEATLGDAGVVTAVREGRLRLSFHGYNDESDIDRLLSALPT